MRKIFGPENGKSKSASSQKLFGESEYQNLENLLLTSFSNINLNIPVDENVLKGNTIFLPSN